MSDSRHVGQSLWAVSAEKLHNRCQFLVQRAIIGNPSRCARSFAGSARNPSSSAPHRTLGLLPVHVLIVSLGARHSASYWAARADMEVQSHSPFPLMHYPPLEWCGFTAVAFLFIGPKQHPVSVIVSYVFYWFSFVFLMLEMKGALRRVLTLHVSLQKASGLMTFTRVLSKAEFPVYLYILCSMCARMIVLNCCFIFTVLLRYLKNL